MDTLNEAADPDFEPNQHETPIGRTGSYDDGTQLIRVRVTDVYEGGALCLREIDEDGKDLRQLLTGIDPTKFKQD